MFTHPYIAGKLDYDRHRDMRADVGRHRLARQLRDLAATARRAEGTPHRQRRIWRPVLRLRARAARSGVTRAVLLGLGPRLSGRRRRKHSPHLRWVTYTY